MLPETWEPFFFLLLFGVFQALCGTDIQHGERTGSWELGTESCCHSLKIFVPSRGENEFGQECLCLEYLQCDVCGFVLLAPLRAVSA